MSDRPRHYTTHGRPIEPCPLDRAAALELRIEEAWVRLTAVRRQRGVTVYLTEKGTIAGLTPYEPRCAGSEVGTYNREVTLADFRADVLHVFEQQRRAA